MKEEGDGGERRRKEKKKVRLVQIRWGKLRVRGVARGRFSLVVQ